jgi:hypothetical protein
MTHLSVAASVRSHLHGAPPYNGSGPLDTVACPPGLLSSRPVYSQLALTGQ